MDLESSSILLYINCIAARLQEILLPVTLCHHSMARCTKIYKNDQKQISCTCDDAASLATLWH